MLPESSSRPLLATLAQSRNFAQASHKTAVHICTFQVWTAPIIYWPNLKCLLLPIVYGLHRRMPRSTLLAATATILKQRVIHQKGIERDLMVSLTIWPRYCLLSRTYCQSWIGYPSSGLQLLFFALKLIFKVSAGFNKAIVKWAYWCLSLPDLCDHPIIWNAYLTHYVILGY